MQHHDEATRAAVMSALLQGQGTMEVAKEYSLPPTTVSRWRKEARALAGAPEIGELLMSYLVANLETLESQCEVFSDPEWLRVQGASELGVLHGIMTDKAVRLLEALSGGPLERKRV